MTRAALDYRDRRDLAPGGFDPDVPTPGFYRMRLRRGAIPVGVHIFYGQTLDPETGEPLDRWFWQATVNGEPSSVDQVWPICAKEPIDRREHDYLVESQRWGREHDPDGPYANRSRPIDLLTAPMPF